MFSLFLHSFYLFCIIMSVLAICLSVFLFWFPVFMVRIHKDPHSMVSSLINRIFFFDIDYNL